MDIRGAYYRIAAASIVVLGSIAAPAAVALAEDPPPDSLYIGDLDDDTVKRFDAKTGKFQGDFVGKGKTPLKGPMGLIFNSDHDMVVSNQNSGANKSGEILKQDGATGAFLGALVPHNDPSAPFAPRGVVLNDGVLFVASIVEPGKNNPPGRLLAYTEEGVFLADLTPDHDTEFPGAFSTEEFHPRGVVIGPDGLLYVSVVDDPELKLLPGWVLRFDPDDNGSFVDVFASDQDPGCAAHLHRPEGLVFGPDGNLYVTAFRASAADTDKILILNGSTGACLGQIELAQVGAPRAFAQALLFGPAGFLFVPISGGGSAGAVRRYNVTDPAHLTFPFTSIVPPAASGGPLGQPWYLTFGKTNPATLAYDN